MDEIAPTHQEGRDVAHIPHVRHTLERRTQIVEAALPAILAGQTLREIAAAHAIPWRTLHLWLSALGDDYAETRRTWLDSMLADAHAAIEDDAGDQLQLARARERWKSATWYAERRDPARYAVKQQVEGAVNIQIVIER